MIKSRSAGIVIKDGSIVLMRRVNNGREYFTFAGRGVEEGETPEQAVVREFMEETGMVIEPTKLLYHVSWDDGGENYYYLCKYVSGEPELLESSEEFEEMKKGDQVYDPKWVSISELP